MVAAALCRVTGLAFTVGLLTSCGTSQSNGTTTRTRGDEGDAGDAGAESECSFTPCGGDIVGSWTIRSVCPVSVSVRDCPTAELEPNHVTVMGSVTFGADGGLAFDITSTGTWDGLVPPSCVVGTDCAAIAQSLYQRNAPPASCTSAGDGGCSCSSPATPVQTDMGPYTISGNTAANMSFCVRNDLLKLQNGAGTVFVARR
jgi:hypothetical protein